MGLLDFDPPVSRQTRSHIPSATIDGNPRLVFRDSKLALVLFPLPPSPRGNSRAAQNGKHGAVVRMGMGMLGVQQSGPPTLANPGACQNILPGSVPIPGLPQCDLQTGCAPGVSQQECDIPFIAGYAYGTPEYTALLKSGAADAGVDSQDIESQNAVVASVLSSLPQKTTSPAAAPVTTPSSSAPSSSAPSQVTQSQVTNATNSEPLDLSATTVPVVGSSSWLTESSIDSIPNWALLAGAGLLLFLMMGGKK